MSSFGQRRLRPFVRRSRRRLDNPEVRAGRWLLQKVLSGPADILHFGASESMVVADYDDDLRTLPQMIQDGLAAGTTLVSTAGPTYHPRLIRSFLTLLQRRASPNVKIVVVTIVIRSAQAPWSRHPAYHYEPAISALDRVGRRRPVALVHSVIGLPTQAEMDRYDKLPFPTLLADQSIGDYRRALKAPGKCGGDEGQQVLYAYHHGGTEPPPASWLTQITELAATIRAMGAVGVVYHPPVPLHRGEELLGAELRTLNRNIMEAAQSAFRAGDPAARFVRSALDHETPDYVDPLDGTEHLNQAGRQRLARDILEQIRLCEPSFVSSTT